MTKIRRGQLITTQGVGSMVTDKDNETFLILSSDSWVYLNKAKYVINEPRLQRYLGVRTLIQPPPAETKRGYNGEETVKEYIKQNELTARVHFLQNVTYSDLPGIYQQAEVFIYPSRFEGFGIPIIEAMHSGTPVIAAKGSCLEEAGGPGSIYVDPDDEIDLAKQIKNILENDELRANMISSGRRYLEEFEDRKIAGQLIQLYQNVIDNA